MSRSGAVLDVVLPSLACPVCTESLHRDERQVSCPRGHTFDVARQGYLNLAVGERAGTADTTEMVQARERFLGAGHYHPLAALLADVAARHATAPGLVLDLAGGTGYYLAAVLDVLPEDVGVCADLSTPALRRAARAHRRAVAIGADAWRRLPLADASVGIVLNVFGPRDPAEITRVIAPGGVLVTAAPAPVHLRELIQPLGMLGVHPDKAQRRAEAFADFDVLESQTWIVELTLEHPAVTDLVGMGPTAAHVDAQAMAARVARLPDPATVTASVEVTAYRAGGG